MKTALLTIDMQVFFEDSAAPVLPHVNELCNHFHKHEMPVVYTQHGHTPAQLEGTEPSQLVQFWSPQHSIHRFSPQWELLPDLAAPRDGDILVQDKDTYDPFIHTRLEDKLRSHGVERVLVVGVLTNFCCETTARSAFNRGFETWTISDACGAEDPEMHDASLRAIAAGFGQVLTTKEAIRRLRGDVE